MAPKAVSQVRRLTNTVANRTGLKGHHDRIATGFVGAHQCDTRGPALPSPEWLAAVLVEKPPMHRIYVALATDNTPLGMVVVHNPSEPPARIVWLVANETDAEFGAVAAALCAKVVQDYGVPTYGEVHQSAVRALFLAASPRFSVDADGVTIRFT